MIWSNNLSLISAIIHVLLLFKMLKTIMVNLVFIDVWNSWAMWRIKVLTLLSVIDTVFNSTPVSTRHRFQTDENHWTGEEHWNEQGYWSKEGDWNEEGDWSEERDGTILRQDRYHVDSISSGMEADLEVLASILILIARVKLRLARFEVFEESTIWHHQESSFVFCTLCVRWLKFFETLMTGRWVFSTIIILGMHTEV